MVKKEDKRRTVVEKEDKYTSSLGLRKKEDTELKRRTVLLKGGRLATLDIKHVNYEYNAFVWPTLEECSAVWDPYMK